MYNYPVKYTDYNGVEKTETYQFNLSQAELMEMELASDNKLSDSLKDTISNATDAKVIHVFKDLILKSYGEKSADGSYFLKKDANGVPLSIKFEQSEAYNTILMEILSDPEKASAFVTGILPSKLAEEAKKQMKDNDAVKAISMKTSAE